MQKQSTEHLTEELSQRLEAIDRQIAEQKSGQTPDRTLERSPDLPPEPSPDSPTEDLTELPTTVAGSPILPNLPAQPTVPPNLPAQPTVPPLPPTTSQPLDRRRFPLGNIILTLMVVLAAAAGVALARVAPITAFDWGALFQGKDSRAVFLEGLSRKLTKPYQILIVGVDRVPEATLDSPESFNGRSDTMFLVRFDPGANQPDSSIVDKKRGINLLSIPRDTQIQLPQYGMVKINAANVYGGAALAKEAVKETLGGVAIDRYVRVDPAALVALVDALGGVEIDVPNQMRYVDKTQKLDINLEPGKQMLNGKQAEGFARFRHDEDGDIGRIKRQQILLKAIKARFSDPMLLLRLPDLINLIQQHINTDLSLEEMLSIAALGATLKPEQIETLTLPGRPSEDYEFDSSYWLVDPAQVDAMIKGKFTLDPKLPPQ